MSAFVQSKYVLSIMVRHKDDHWDSSPVGVQEKPDDAAFLNTEYSMSQQFTDRSVPDMQMVYKISNSFFLVLLLTIVLMLTLRK